MGMEHKAYLFDTNRFDRELKPVINTSVLLSDTKGLEDFISSHVGEVRSVYTGELLGIDWKNSLENGGIQELCDIALTLYYSPDEDMGLSYGWDALNEALSMTSIKFPSDYYILGESIEYGSFQLDPGGLGLGFVYSKDIAIMYNDLVSIKSALNHNGLPDPNAVLYQLTKSELLETYNELVLLYSAAYEKKWGLLMTF
ncbi:hypothetical protein [Paenibacillus turpanensis]|uniref:hypothetical protein n=1 Tax=Paenibacillus turpanensis TaxID=2689078 RepID=UPI001408C610|nr:hypothetical protein [Paenibacillus turpanensis]